MFIDFGFWEANVCSGPWALLSREQTNFILFFFPLECSGLRRSLLGVLWVPPCPVGWLGRFVCLFGAKHLQLWRQRCGWVRGTSQLDGDTAVQKPLGKMIPVFNTQNSSFSFKQRNVGGRKRDGLISNCHKCLTKAAGVPPAL